MTLGEFVVVVLVIMRINAEERLLKGTFPAFEEYERATRHRLFPGIW
jgi:protein-S-isoprenylcysteine O-methyltransferase Ste14